MRADTGIEALETVGTHVLRYGLGLLLLMWGAAKFTAFEADAIKPLVEHSPLLGWLYSMFTVRGDIDALRDLRDGRGRADGHSQVAAAHFRIREHGSSRNVCG